MNEKRPFYETPFGEKREIEIFYWRVMILQSSNKRKQFISTSSLSFFIEYFFPESRNLRILRKKNDAKKN